MDKWYKIKFSKHIKNTWDRNIVEPEKYKKSSGAEVY
jgi:hypothetical protein